MWAQPIMQNGLLEQLKNEWCLYKSNQSNKMTLKFIG